MNELNELEKQLRAWAPRRPSARLKQKIFAPSTTGANRFWRRLPRVRLPGIPALGRSSHARSHPAFAWFAPATAAFLAAIVLVSERTSGPFAVKTSSSPLVAVALSNQSAAAWLPGAFAREVNALPVTFEWTNESASTSSIGSLLGRRSTN